MPPKTRSSRTARKAAPPNLQSTLSFHGKPSQITKRDVTPSRGKKPSAATKDAGQLDAAAAAASVKAEPQTPDTEPAESKPEVKPVDALPDPLAEGAAPSTTEDVLGGRAEPSDAGALGGTDGSGWLGDEEQRARKITETQINRYWRAKEQERLAPRVHQKGLGVHEKVLREWDMSGQYGPCMGIARLKRWKRANLLGLNPPMEVLAVLLKEIDAGETKALHAYADDLMASRRIEP